MEEFLRITMLVAAFYGAIIALLVLIALVSRPTPSVALLGTALTTVTLLLFGVAPGVAAAMVSFIAVTVVYGLAHTVSKRATRAALAEISLMSAENQR